ncbi:MAG TPA: hypothetical protein VFB00_04345 [Terriglobales bacterium]|nr:hypothetical protein [Terriglobales bacterium]
MKTFAHLERHGNSHFHMHPLNATFSLIASLVLAMLVVLLFAISAK